MIEKIYRNRHQLICNNCGHGKEFSNWNDLMFWLGENGWSTRREDDDWAHYCSECVEAEEVD